VAAGRALIVWAGLAAGAAAAALSSACASASRSKSVDEARPFFDQGMQAVERGELDVGIGKFSQAIDAYPDYADAYFRRGSARLRRVMTQDVAAQGSELERAEADFTEALRIAPVFYEAFYNRGLARAALAKYRAAAEDFQNALLSSDAALKRDAHAKLARILDEKFENMQPQAVGHYEKCLEMGGGNAELRARLAALKAGRLLGVEADKRAELESHAQALFIQAVKEAEAGDRKKALETIERAIATGALPADKREFAAASFAQWKLQEDAEDAAGVLLREAESLIREGNRALATEILSRAAARYPATRTVRERVAPLLQELRGKPK